MWPDILSDRLPVIALVGRYPANELIGREPLPERIAALLLRDHQVLIPVSRGYPCLRGRLLTCYSPVRHSVTEATPCDLHVLSTPPAFVLSQNQTLHNI